LVNVLLFLQVLHLMNKMNIPAPFRMALPTPPLSSHVSSPQPPPPPPPPPPQPSITEDLRSADLSSDESELESSDVCSTSAFLVFTL
jgi:U11/U12 small nuclear ribonucleoprotein 65 kDa protein